MEGQKKVMHIVQTLEHGGVQQMYFSTVNGLHEKGKINNIACIIFDEIHFHNRISSGIKSIYLNLPYSRSPVFMAFMRIYEFLVLLKVIYRENPDTLCVYHGAFDQFLVSIAGKILGKRVIIRKFEQETIQWPPHRILNRITYLLCDCVVAISKACFEELISKGVPRNKINLIFNGKKEIELDDLLEKDIAKKRLGLESSDFVIGTVARISPEKNHAAVIESLPGLLLLNDKIKFVIAGDVTIPAYDKKIRQLIQEKGLEDNVIFLGWRDDVRDVLPAFDIFVHPSFSEGCPGAVIEAMFAGLPIIASDAGGTRDLLAGWGLIVSAEDAKTLELSLKNLINNPGLRGEYGRKARIMAEKNFSEEIMVEKFEDLLLRL